MAEHCTAQQRLSGVERCKGEVRLRTAKARSCFAQQRHCPAQLSGAKAKCGRALHSKGTAGLSCAVQRHVNFDAQQRDMSVNNQNNRIT